MKKKLLFLLSFFITSCVPLQYCQLYQVNPISVIQVKEDALTYEDDNCLVYYNFWKEYGEIGFVFYNKTSDYLYLHLNECCYVINGIKVTCLGTSGYTSINSLPNACNVSLISESLSGLGFLIP